MTEHRVLLQVLLSITLMECMVLDSFCMSRTMFEFFATIFRVVW